MKAGRELDKIALIEVFEEVLKYYEWSENTVINDRSINFEEDYNQLEEDIKDYRKRFYKALGVEVE